MNYIYDFLTLVFFLICVLLAIHILKILLSTKITNEDILDVLTNYSWKTSSQITDDILKKRNVHGNMNSNYIDIKDLNSRLQNLEAQGLIRSRQNTSDNNEKSSEFILSS